MRPTFRDFALCALWLAATVVSAAAEPAGDFYSGKTITLVVGTTAGDEYDTWARQITRYMRKYIPGNPGFVTQNMPGSGFIIAANYLYNVAHRDGTVIGMVGRNIPYSDVQGLASVRYDSRRFNWLGNADGGNRVCFARTDSGIGKAEDLFERELIVGGTAHGSGVSATPALVKGLVGMKIKLVEGYRSANDTALAMERGEVQAMCETWNAFNRRRPQWIPSGFARGLFNMENRPVPGVVMPSIYQFLKTDEQRAIATYYASSIDLGRPMLMPPDVPADRVALLRKAFMSAVTDPDFVAEAKAAGWDLYPMSGADLQALVNSVLATPKELAKKTEALIGMR